MADTITPNMGLTKPEIGASANSWGNKLNENFNILDSKVVRNTIQWNIKMGDEIPASLTGPFIVSRYNNSAVKIDEPLVIDRQTGDVTILKALNVASINAGAMVGTTAYAYKPTTPAAPAAGFANIYLDAAGNPVIQKPDGTIQYLGVPPGTVAFTGGATADVGWALMNGQAISRTLYSAVFARYGTTFGIGDGFTTFNLPDVKGRVIVHAGTGTGLTARALGEIFGAETHTLTVAQIPAHDHDAFIRDPSHKHNTTFAGGTLKGGYGGFDNPTPGNVDTDLATTGVRVNSVSGGLPATDNKTALRGGGGSHPIVPPTIVLNAQVKLG